MNTIYFTLLSLSLAISTIALNYSTYKSSKQRLLNTQRQIQETIELKYGELKAELPKIYDQLEKCSNYSCFSAQSTYEAKSFILKEYYALAECKTHLNQLTNIDRYMEARFYIARTLSVEKKKMLPLNQKNYYSVISEEFNQLSKTKCNLGVI